MLTAVLTDGYPRGNRSHALRTTTPETAMHALEARTAVRHLAIEATRLVQEKRGIARYVRNVVRELATQHDTLQFSWHVADPHDEAPLIALLQALHPTLVARSTIEPLAALEQSPADIAWYAWNFITVPARRAARVVTIHDLAPMMQLDHRWWKVLKRAKYRRRYARTVAHADAIVTDSVFSRRELQQHLGVPSAQITVTLLAADDLPVSTGSEPDVGEALLQRAGVSGPFFLYVGAQDGRKNLGTLYDAMGQLWHRGHHVPLVQCGPSVSRETQALLGRVPWLTHVGYVSDAELASLYRRSTALVFPSCYEGFGLPVVEAMRVGTPVICAAGSSLAEVVGTAALQVPWQDATGFATEMQRLLLHAPLRAELRERSLAQAGRYSWARTARETYALFTRVLARRAEQAVLLERAGRGSRLQSSFASAFALRSPSRSAPLTAGAPVTAAARVHTIAQR